MRHSEEVVCEVGLILNGKILIKTEKCVNIFYSCINIKIIIIQKNKNKEYHAHQLSMK